eukprot:14339183-Ditylum_brightwellii.AAC.1
MRRFPDEIDHTIVTSCSLPRHDVPVWPASIASALENPKRLSGCGVVVMWRDMMAGQVRDGFRNL